MLKLQQNCASMCWLAYECSIALWVETAHHVSYRPKRKKRTNTWSLTLTTTQGPFRYALDIVGYPDVSFQTFASETGLDVMWNRQTEKNGWPCNLQDLEWCQGGSPIMEFLFGTRDWWVKLRSENINTRAALVFSTCWALSGRGPRGSALGDLPCIWRGRMTKSTCWSWRERTAAEKIETFNETSAPKNGCFNGMMVVSPSIHYKWVV